MGGSTMSLSEFVDSRLSGSAPARNLRTHLRNFEARIQAPAADSARTRITLLRRTLIHGLENGKRFGLPEKLPRVVALLDLSGEKALLTSEEDTMLVAAAVTGFSACQHRERHLVDLCALESWASDRDMSFLVVAVLPWQAGVGNCAFEVRTFKQCDTRILDGQKLIADHLIGVRDGSRTGNPQEAPVGAKEVRALGDIVSAVSVDGSAPVESDTKWAMLQDTARRLMAERTEMRLEMQKQRERENERVQQAVTKKEAIALEKHTQATRLRNACEEKMKASDAAVQAARSEKNEAEKAAAEAKRALAEMSLHLVETEQAAQKQKKLANAASSASAKQLGDLRAQLQELHKQQRDNGLASRAEEAERTKLKGELGALRPKVKEHADTIGKLAAVLERTESERNNALAQLEEARRATKRSNESSRRADVERKEAESRIAEVRAALEAARSQLETERRCSRELAENAREKEERATGPTSVSTQVQTSCFGTNTHMIAQTQTDPWSEQPLALSNAEIAREAHRALNRLAETCQLPKAVYQPSFHGHIPPPTFRPPGHFDA